MEFLAVHIQRPKKFIRSNKSFIFSLAEMLKLKLYMIDGLLLLHYHVSSTSWSRKMHLQFLIPFLILSSSFAIPIFSQTDGGITLHHEEHQSSPLSDPRSPRSLIGRMKDSSGPKEITPLSGGPTLFEPSGTLKTPLMPRSRPDTRSLISRGVVTVLPPVYPEPRTRPGRRSLYKFGPTGEAPVVEAPTVQALPHSPPPAKPVPAYPEIEEVDGGYLGDIDE